MKTFEQANQAEGKLENSYNFTGKLIEAGNDQVWEVCNKYVVTDTGFTVTGLTPGSTPLFRIVAVNEFGESRYSNVVGPITCKDDVIFPGIEVLGFKEIENGNKLNIYAKVCTFLKRVFNNWNRLLATQCPMLNGSKRILLSKVMTK